MTLFIKPENTFGTKAEDVDDNEVEKQHKEYKDYFQQLRNEFYNRSPMIFVCSEKEYKKILFLQQVKEKRIKMVTVEVEKQTFNIVFKHDINHRIHPNPKQNKNGTYRDPYTDKAKLIVRGGTTTCFLTRIDNNGEVELYYEGEAICNEKDMYNRSIGREIAFGRAVKKYEQHQLTEITNWLREQYNEIQGASPGVDKQEARKKVMANASEAMDNISNICNQLKEAFKNRKKK